MTTFFPWKRGLHSKTVWFCLLVILSFGLIAALAPWIAPHDPYQWGFHQSGLPAMWVVNSVRPGQAEYPLGTDRYGRDILSRLIFGTRTAYFLALTAVPLAGILGTLVGLIAGYVGGSLDAGLMLFANMVQSLPGIMFMVITVLIFRTRLEPTWINGLITLVIGFAAVSWVSLARQIRVEVLQLRHQLYIEAAQALGASPHHVMLRHLLPNSLHVILVWVINNIPAVILLEAVLGYIGVGVTGATDGSEFTTVSWGGLFFAGRSWIGSNPLMLFLPSLCILLLSMSFILLADFLNNIFRQGSSDLKFKEET